jgi:hypothetical protein
VPENAQSKGLSLKERRHATHIDEFDDLHDILGRTEYAVRNRAIASSASPPTGVQKLCGSCHDVCLRCHGPTADECLTCEADYDQIIIGSKIACHSRAVPAPTPPVDKLNVIANQLRDYSGEQIVLISAIVGVGLAAVAICIYLLFARCNLASFNGRTKLFMGRAMGTNSGGAMTEREKYSYNIVEMEETSPLTVVKPTDFQIANDDDDDEDSDFP